MEIIGRVPLDRANPQQMVQALARTFGDGNGLGLAIVVSEAQLRATMTMAAHALASAGVRDVAKEGACEEQPSS